MGHSVFDIIPQDLQLEQAIIGGMILWGAEKVRLSTTLIGPDDFYQTGLGNAFRVISAMHSQGVEATIGSLTTAIERWNARRPQQRVDYGVLMECWQYAEDNEKPANFEPYCNALRELSRRRQIQALILEAGKLIADPENYADPILQVLRDGTSQILAGGIAPDEIKTARQAAEEERAELRAMYDTNGIDAMMGVPTGVGWLDNALGGWQEGDLIFEAARPNTSKTRWNIWSMGWAALQGYDVGFISLDMGKRRLRKYVNIQLANLAGEQAHVSDIYRPYAWGPLEQARFDDILSAVDPNEKFHMVEQPMGSRITNIERWVSVLAGKYNCKVITIDQVQNIAGWSNGGSNRSEYNNIVSALKDMARHYKVALRCLHQIGRPGANAPTLANLKDTGCIEEMADAVIILHDTQRAIKDMHGGFVKELAANGLSHFIRAPKKGDDPGDIIRNVEPVRDLRVALEKNRNEAIQTEYMRFDFQTGTKA